MEPMTVAIAGIICLLILLTLGLPIAFVMLLVGFGGLVVLLGVKAAMMSMSLTVSSSLLSYLMTVLPMFILMGQFTFHSGISKELLDLGQKWLSRLPGGLACATVLGSAMFAACTGSSLATAAAVGKIAIPEMEEAGYHPSLASGSVAAAGTLGILIPPSIAAVLYAAASEESVAMMLFAGLIPGVLSAAVYMGMIIVRAKFVPGLAPPTVGFSWKERLVSLKGVWGLIVIFTLCMGSIYFGWATPTEAGAVGALGTLIIALLRRKCKLNDLWAACCGTARTLSMVSAIYFGSTVFGLFIARTGFPLYFAEFTAGLPLPPLLIVIAIFLMYIPMGMFIDPVAMILLTVPIVYPTVIALGFNGIWFGIILIVMCEIALITPPLAVNIFIVKGVAKHIALEDIIKGIIPFFIMDMITVAILIAFPQICLWLPNQMMR